MCWLPSHILSWGFMFLLLAHAKGVAVCTQMRRCVLKFCQTDKSSTRICIFAFKILCIAPDVHINYQLTRQYEIPFGIPLTVSTTRPEKCEFLHNVISLSQLQQHFKHAAKVYLTFRSDVKIFFPQIFPIIFKMLYT